MKRLADMLERQPGMDEAVMELRRAKIKVAKNKDVMEKDKEAVLAALGAKVDHLPWR